MKTYARIIAGLVVEVFPPAFQLEDVFIPGVPAVEPTPANPEGTPAVPPVLIHSKGDPIPLGDRFHPDFVAQLVECPEDTLAGYTFDGQSFYAPAPPAGPTFEQRKSALLAAVDAHLNAAAKAKGYDGILSASLRAALPTSPFHAEGVAFGSWMDAVYAKCYEVLAQVQANETAEPDEAQLIAMLPALQLPS